MDSTVTYLKNEIKKVIKGKDEIIDKTICAILAGGHILLEDIPGVGKTTLATAISKSMALNYKRVQFTPDVLPSDLIGFSMPNSITKEFEFKPGAVFCNLFLADEINRTSPKTQSALLEVMEEGNVSVDGITKQLPKPFIVIATQNPIGSSGTQRLPESQLDRFMIRLSMGYPDHENAIQILKGNAYDALSSLSVCGYPDTILELQDTVGKIFVDDSIYEYIITLTEATRNPEEFSLGLSPRGSIALLKMAKASAFLNLRNYVTANDVISVFFDVSCHRVLLSGKARAQGLTIRQTLSNLILRVPVTRI
ncbi:AAA family ATPase [Anaeromicropila populeti]|uniref:MoxR-like ATPase n=1 Tax=Anaeromicropila populeti TaxID=37658 RepID=A0A1I6HJG3_9FIRM|nr:MoxR family ATPase [Anaeromicropila populeti]SFR54514.1 MoxR-like ATPase [Anaeromicropila populeti]